MKKSDWRVETLSRMRTLIEEADPDVVEELKWVKPTSPGTPTWSHDGIICTAVRYIDIHEDDELDEELVTSWIRQASELPGWVP
jgi:hypothetical protein